MSILENRYASPEMRSVWSSKNKIIMERELWLEVLTFQANHGFSIAREILEDYRRVVEIVDLESIASREQILRHDVKARLDEFNSLAGHDFMHLGMTSRDLTENIEAWQIRASLELIRKKSIAFLSRLSIQANKFSTLPMVARTHNVPAQVTTLGKRFATISEESLIAFRRLNELITTYPMRGIKGAVGTSQDMIEFLERDVDLLDKQIAKRLNFTEILDSTGQIAPRSLDLNIISVLVQISAAPTNFALLIRLMASLGLAREGFGKNQVGSSAMPHKINSRLSERICGFMNVLRGHLTMVSGLAGDQWNEGDVSDSVVRRVVFPDAFFVLDGLLDTSIHVIDEMVVDEVEIQRELKRYLPLLASSQIMSSAIRKGMPRQTAYLKIQSAARSVTDTSGAEILLSILAQDSEFPLDQAELESILMNPMVFTGNARAQVKRICDRISQVEMEYPEARNYNPSTVL